MRKNCLFIFVMMVWFTSRGQNYETERIIPPNPIAASFKLYGDVPVGYNTGVPDITIPLYTIQVGDFSLPIELKYHINSLKPASCRTNVALGWSLHYGAIISKTIYGKPDEYYNLITFGTGIGASSSAILRDILRTDHNGVPSYGDRDSEHDIFNYTIPGASGEFILDINHTVYQMSHHPVSINYIDEHKIDIINDHGDSLKFGYGLNETTIMGNQSFTSSWLLSQIALACNRTIDFLYEDVPYYLTDSFEKELSIMDNLNYYAYNGSYQSAWYGVGSGPSVCDGPTYEILDAQHATGHLEKNISEIHFPNGKIVFDLSSDKRIITGVRVYNANELIKSYEFECPVTGGSMGGMNLMRKIIVKDRLSNQVNGYQFEYYDEAVISANVNTDYWGYCNSLGENYFPLGQYALEGPASPCDGSGFFSGTTTGGKSKDPDLGYLRKNALKKVIYPTGGYSEFEYGLNEYRFNGQVKAGNGLRVQKITDNNNNGLTTTKTFEYEPQDRYGDYIFQVNNFVNTHYSVGSIPHLDENGISRARYRTYSSATSSRIANYLLNIQYSKVTEIIGDGVNNVGKNVYYYEYSNDHERTYFASAIPISDFAGASFSLLKYRNWDNGLLYRKETYRKDETQPALVNSYTYQHHYDPEPFKNTFVFQISYYPGDSDDSTTRESIISNTGGMLGTLPEQEKLYLFPPVYGYYNYDIVTGWLQLENEITMEYRNGGSITTTTTYEYGGAEKYYPSRKTITASDGVDVVTNMKYPYDFAGTAPYSTMVNRNIISPVVELLSSKGATELESIKTNYWDWGNNIVAPKSVEYKTGTNAYETRLSYRSYDAKGNTLSVSKDSGPATSYLWGYDHIYPIAKIENADYSTVETVLGGSTAVEAFSATVNPTDAQVRSFLAPLYTDGRLSKAMVTTYTYKPLIGMTSSTDPDGFTTYYEYDDFGRLEIVRDHDNNIVKTYSYHYRE